MNHWFIRALPWIVRGAQFVIWLVGGWAAVSTPWRGEPIGVVAFYGLGSFTIMLAASYYILRIGEYIEGRTVDAQLGGVFSRELEDRLSVNETEMLVTTASAIWSDIDPAPRTQRRGNTKYRWVKAAIDLGYAKGTPLNSDGTAFKQTVVNVGELAAFFKRP